ncbi:serine hydrolase [Kordiimonas sp.]|uniref:serine hydrolase n=1 Tax=Kordiimonas sp. TaxID=1970157 RepID=UPI003A8EC777
MKRTALAILSVFFLSCAASAQGVVLRADEVLPHLKAVTADAFFVNGYNIYGYTDAGGNEGRGLQRLKLRLTALRLLDDGHLSIDQPISQHLPEIVGEYPFKVALTLRHLLTGTGGFAAPPGGLINPDISLRSYAIEVRTPGHVSTDDLVGDAVLTKLIEQVTGLSLHEVFKQHLTSPLGYPLVPGLARVLLYNETPDRQAFLSDALYRLIASETLWRLHPMGPMRSAVGDIRMAHGLSWLEITPGVIAFPREGVVFIAPNLTAGEENLFRSAVIAVARNHFPPRSIPGPLDEARHLARPSEVGGRYTLSGKPSAWLQTRAKAMAHDWMALREEKDGSLNVSLAKVPSQDATDTPRPFDPRFLEVAPYRYENRTGNVLTLSPYRMGGYAYLDDRLFHRTGPLGHMDLIARLVPWVFAALLTAALHLKSPVGRPWRYMAAFALTGTGLIGAALAAEWYVWPSVMYGFDLPILVTLWRVGLNIGLMLILAVPLLAVSFVRRGLLPERGVAFILAGPHLALLSIAAMALFLITVALGLAGNFTAL